MKPELLAKLTIYCGTTSASSSLKLHLVIYTLTQ